jgi:tRNA A37 threonylcarbamoyladenosine dehydratase
VYSTQQQQYPTDDGGVAYAKPEVKGVRLDCASGFGSATQVTATFGFVATAKIIEDLLKKKTL